MNTPHITVTGRLERGAPRFQVAMQGISESRPEQVELLLAAVIGAVHKQHEHYAEHAGLDIDASAQRIVDLATNFCGNQNVDLKFVVGENNAPHAPDQSTDPLDIGDDEKAHRPQEQDAGTDDEADPTDGRLSW